GREFECVEAHYPPIYELGRGYRTRDFWILGFNRCIGRSSALVSELWALVEGLEEAWQQGYRLVIIESDCMDARQLVKGTGNLFKGLDVLGFTTKANCFAQLKKF
ncbi:hypothetical protein Gotri_015248, partial [Gossypium trilobum]|nr:hypothetical protein [Gossypium trilobum]